MALLFCFSRFLSCSGRYDNDCSINNIIIITGIYFHWTGKWYSMTNIHRFTICFILICINKNNLCK